MNQYVDRVMRKDRSEVIELLEAGELDRIVEFAEREGFGRMELEDAAYLWGAFSERYAFAICLVVDDMWLHRFGQWMRGL